MTNPSYDFSSQMRPNLPTPAGPWNGAYPKFNFTGGNTAQEEIPIDDLIGAATRALEKHGNNLATYFLDGGYLGHKPLRDFLVRKLEERSGISCTADNVLLTSGSLQAIDLVNHVLLEPGDTVIIEEATYAGCLSRFTRAGVTPIGIPLDDGGMRMDALADTLESCKADGVKPKYIYVIPTVQNPTATIMSKERRLELIALSEKFDVPIFEDECYADLLWDSNRPEAIYALDPSGRTFHIGSFSKTVAPALRVGYVVANWSLLGQMVACKSDAGSGALEQMVLAEYCEAHFDTHVTRLTKVLEGRLKALIEAMEENFGTSAEFEKPPGGIFLWIKLPSQVDTSKLAGLAAGAGISINPGADWSHEMDGAKQYLRICFANSTQEALAEGVAKLADICNTEFGVPTRIANLEKN